MELDTEKARVVVSCEAVSKVLPFAAVDDVRYYLNGVAVMPTEGGGVLAVACDGHMLLACHDPDGRADATTILPIRRPQHATELRKRARQGYQVFVHNDHVWIASRKGGDTAWISPDKPIEGRYPDVAAICRSEWRDGLGPAPFSLKLVKRLPSTGALRFFHKAGDEQGTTLFTVEPNAFGFIMPMRTHTEAAEHLARYLPAAFREVSNA